MGACKIIQMIRRLDGVIDSNVFDSEETAPGTLLQDGSRESFEATGGESKGVAGDGKQQDH